MSFLAVLVQIEGVKQKVLGMKLGLMVGQIGMNVLLNFIGN